MPIGQNLNSICKCQQENNIEIDGAKHVHNKAGVNTGNVAQISVTEDKMMLNW